MIIKDWDKIVKGTELNENGQVSPLRFSHAFGKPGDSTIYRSMCFVKCRDYFNELFVVLQGQRSSASVYGFSIYNSRPEGHDKDYLLVSHPDLARLEQCINKVNERLKQRKMGTIKIVQAENGCSEVGVHDMQALNSYLILSVPEYWWRNSFNVHLLTYLIRYEDTEGELDEILGYIQTYISKDPYDLLPLVKKTPSYRGKDDNFPGLIGAFDNQSIHDSGLCFYIRSAAGIKRGYKKYDKISEYILEGVK